MKWNEIFQQQDGALCVLQCAVACGFTCFWLTWLVLTMKDGKLAECPTGLASVLIAMLAAKIWKDVSDYKKPSS